MEEIVISESEWKCRVRAVVDTRLVGVGGCKVHSTSPTATETLILPVSRALHNNTVQNFQQNIFSIYKINSTNRERKTG